MTQLEASSGDREESVPVLSVVQDLSQSVLLNLVLACVLPFACSCSQDGEENCKDH